MGRAASLVLLACAAACGSGDPPAPPARVPTAPAARPPAAAPATAPLRWIPGDLHMHVAPIDAIEGQTLDIPAMAQAMRDTGLEFVIATPHVRPWAWDVPARRAAWLARWAALVDQAHAIASPTIIVGAEFTQLGYGHFGVSGANLGAVGDDVLAGVAAAGGFIVVNHPFALPTSIPGVAASDYDMSFAPWTKHRGAMPHLDGVEVENAPLELANVFSRPGGMTGEQRAFVAADELARRERRRITVTGGSDSHTPAMLRTTWVLAPDASEPAILAALHAGATCVGGPEAGSFEARGDRDPPDRWVRIGGAVTAAQRVELRWTGHARVFVDGVDAGEHDATFADVHAAGVHTYRIELGPSRSGFIYANLD